MCCPFFRPALAGGNVWESAGVEYGRAVEQVGHPLDQYAGRAYFSDPHIILSDICSVDW